jgi:hypothetical protein
MAGILDLFFGGGAIDPNMIPEEYWGSPVDAANAMSLAPQMQQQQPPMAQPQQQAGAGPNWGAGGSMWPMLMGMGAGLLSKNKEGWGEGLGSGLMAGNQMLQQQKLFERDQEDRKLKTALALMQQEALQKHRDATLAQGDERNEIARMSAGQSPFMPAGDGSLTFRRGGPADPEVIKEQSLARGRGADVPQAVRTSAINADQSYKSLVESLDKYEATVKKTGNVFVPGVDADTVDQQRTAIQLQMKELFNLGVLNGPDLALMENMLFDPSAGVLSGFSFDPTKRVERSVKGLKDVLLRLRNSKTRSIGLPDIGGREPAIGEEVDPFGIR